MKPMFVLSIAISAGTLGACIVISCLLYICYRYRTSKRSSARYKSKKRAESIDAVPIQVTTISHAADDDDEADDLGLTLSETTIGRARKLKT